MLILAEKSALNKKSVKKYFAVNRDTFKSFMFIFTSHQTYKKPAYKNGR